MNDVLLLRKTIESGKIIIVRFNDMRFNVVGVKEVEGLYFVELYSKYTGKVAYEFNCFIENNPKVLAMW